METCQVFFYLRENIKWNILKYYIQQQQKTVEAPNAKRIFHQKHYSKNRSIRGKKVWIFLFFKRFDVEFFLIPEVVDSRSMGEYLVWPLARKQEKIIQTSQKTWKNFNKYKANIILLLFSKPYSLISDKAERGTSLNDH